MGARAGGGRWLGPALAVLAAVELLWLGWVLGLGLPNAAASGTRLRRADLLWRALPAVVPGVSWGESHVGAAAEKLRHVADLVDRIPIVAAAGLVALAACGLGQLALRVLGLREGLGGVERAAIGYGLGATLLAGATLVAGRVLGLAPWSVRAALLVPIALEFGLRIGAWRRGVVALAPGGGSRGASPWVALCLLVMAPFAALMALGAMVPTIEFDALEYHLQAPKEYFLAGWIAFLPHNVYASMPFAVEMLHLLGMEVLGDWWRGGLAGQWLVMLFAPATAAVVGITAARLATARAGWVAAAVYLTTPWVYRVAVNPFVEGPLCFHHAALAWLVLRGDRWTWRQAALLGLLAGGALACKYPGAVTAVVPAALVIGVAVVRGRAPRLVRAYALGVAVAAGPWLLKNVVDTGNPVYPLAYGVFGGSGWDDAREAQWSAAHGPKRWSMGALTGSILDVAARSDWQSPLYAMLAPLAFARPGTRRAAAGLAAYAVFLFLVWFGLTHRLERFWLPLLPALAVLAGLGADWTRSRGWSVLLGLLLGAATASNLMLVITPLSGLNEWTAPLERLRDEVPALVNPPLARLDSAVPEGSTVLLVGQAAAFHARARVRYSTVFDRQTFAELARDRAPAQVAEALHARGITHVYVDWSEIDRYRGPGNYGFDPWVTPERFASLVGAGVLAPPEPLGPRHELYRVR